VNGAPREAARNSTVAALLESLSINPQLVVVEHNRRILRERDTYGSLLLANDDIVEIVHFVGGG